MRHYSLEELSQTELHQLNGYPISTHGFINCTATGEIILAESPNVPSCCLSAINKRSHQLYIEGALGQFEEHQIVYLEGKFSFLNEKGQWKMLLKDATLAQHTSEFSFLWIVGALTISCLFFYKRLKTL